jgi:hypothetical protein
VSKTNSPTAAIPYAAYLIDGKYVSNGVKVRSLELCGLFNIHAFEHWSCWELCEHFAINLYKYFRDGVGLYVHIKIC